MVSGLEGFHCVHNVRTYYGYLTSRNICQKVRNFTNNRHTEDAISVNRIVEELQMETPSPVLLYKPQGKEDPNWPLC